MLTSSTIGKLRKLNNLTLSNVSTFLRLMMQARIRFLVRKTKASLLGFCISYQQKYLFIHLLNPRNQFSGYSSQHKAAFKMSGSQVCCMVMRINLDCNACCRKMRRIILRMKEIETHVIEKQHLRVIVCGRFIPADVAIKIRKKMKRRVEILEIQELGDDEKQVEQEQGPQAPDQGMQRSHPYFPGHHHPVAQHAY